ncbi:ammonium transporter [Clostridium sediminicola]|uniref:ammonium transporter n=1 Tax=Clostridium sediminicola TaxID=3114879 RepID=UPI0031F1D5FD
MDLTNVSIAIDNTWVLIATTLVFFMQAGFTMVETGFTRAKNASNIIMKNLMDFSVGSLIYWVLGFVIMFGVDKGGIIGTGSLFSKGSFEHLGLSIPVSTFLIFQTVFCATAATIVSGAMAERTKFKSYLLYSFFLSAIIYPVIGHWIWGGGWLGKIGFHDFAGSTVVHSVGGWAALVGAAIIGPRIGKYGENGEVNAIPAHNITLGALGVFILWFGWFGFNPGSTLSGMDFISTGHIFITTNLAASMGAVVAMTITWIKNGKPDVGFTLNGALAGLVGITAGCDIVSSAGAVAIGFCAGIVVVFGAEIVERKLKVDDPVGAVAVHGLCGAFGTILVGVFATEGGIMYGGGAGLLGVQTIGVFAVGVWTIGTAFVLFKTIDVTVGLRVSEMEEKVGLDIKEHGTSAYPCFYTKAKVNIQEKILEK